jgi:hypothetical protein
MEMQRNRSYKTALQTYRDKLTTPPARRKGHAAKQYNDARDDGGVSSLHQVRVYCGLPESRKDPRGNGARLRQMQKWRNAPGVIILHRPLRYPLDPNLPPQEKGVDVQLAVDVIRMALQDEYQVGIVFSRDTDLRPVLETMVDLYSRTHVRCDVAACQADGAPRRGLVVPSRPVKCHFVGSRDFRFIEDPTDYRKEPQG